MIQIKIRKVKNQLRKYEVFVNGESKGIQNANDSIEYCKFDISRQFNLFTVSDSITDLDINIEIK